ncbi:MAG: hypothetical protein ACOCXP_00400 [Candidatus Dojkabacteria bacterium]
MQKNILNKIKQVNLPVITLKEGDYFVAYTPALDLSSYGKDLKEAQRHFTEAVAIYFEEIIENGSWYDELTSLGWTINEKKQEFLAPVVVSHDVQEVPIELNHASI